MSPRRRAAGLLSAAAVLAVLLLASLAIGNKHLPPGEVWRLLLHPDDGFDSAVIWSQRLPRTAIAAAVGAALGLAGTLMQGLTRNPLADPGLLGLSNGAALAIVVAIAVFGWTSPAAYMWSGLVFSALTAVAVYVIGASGRAGASPVRLVLAGTAVNAVLLAVISAFVLLDGVAFEKLRFWQVGSIAGRDISVLVQVAPFLAVGAVLALSLGPSLNALSLGDDTGRALGARLGRTRVLAAAAITLLTAGAVAVAGPIVFVGLLVPHAVRHLTGPDHRRLLPASAVVGAALLLAADTLGRVVLGRDELEVGLVTAILGAPVLMSMVRRPQRTRSA